MTRSIATPRLLLRPLEAGDAAALVRGLNNFNVAKWTGRIPWPYGPDDAAAFLSATAAAQSSPASRAIERDGALIGVIAIERGEIGYWLAEPFWGRGYGKEAARAMADHGFTGLALPALTASHHLGNEASRRILLGLGFTETGQDTAHSRARDAMVPIARLMLPRTRWLEARERGR